MYNTLDGQIYFYLLVKDKLFYDFFNFNLSFTIGKTKYSLKKNLVTGATGLVGTHIVLDLLKKGQAVRATCTPRSNKKIMEQVFQHYNCHDLFGEIEWVNMELDDVTEVFNAVDGVDFVYHSAAIVSFNKSDFNSMRIINIEGTANIVNACLEKKVQKLGFISSIASIGRQGSGHYNEKNKWSSGKENSFYALTKYKAENEVWRGLEEGLDAVICNPGIILGPSNWRRSSTTLFKQIYKGLSHYPLGENGFVDVRDVSKAIIQLVEKDIKGERYILVGENLPYKVVFDEIATQLNKQKPHKKATKSLLELAWRMEAIRCFITNRKPGITKETARTSNQVNIYDNQKVIDELNFTFNSIKDAVSNTASYFLKFK